MCVSHMDNGKRFTTCECPQECPAEDSEPVCTFYNRQFNSRCEMHKYACAHDLTMKVKNQGSCPSRSKCSKLLAVLHDMEFAARFHRLLEMMKQNTDKRGIIDNFQNSENFRMALRHTLGHILVSGRLKFLKHVLWPV